MPRFLLGWLLGLGGNAVGLLLAGLILPQDQFHFTSATGFFVSLVLFAILSGLFTWLVLKFLIRNAGSIVALTGLIATFLALFVTNVLPWGSLDISGMGWIWGTLIVWICGMFIWLLPGPWRNFKKEGRG
ncbi:MAG: hypothetical protein IPO93_02970 [Actinobacteria bacterium]|jgi:hypothetical protein|nr:hypothetical protein [Actinomycetota bacterium]